MSTGVRDLRACDVTSQGSQAELARLLEDSRFHATDRQKEILRYLAERRLSGCDEGVKAYAIAIDVLGRPSSFDPSTDPIVRIEISRLRTAVANYYEAFGTDGEIAVGVPKGRYIAEFTRTLPAPYSDDIGLAGQEHTTEAAEEANTAVGERVVRSSFQRLGLYALGSGFAVAVGAIAMVYWHQPKLTGRPVVSITMQAADDNLKVEASQTRDMLLTALTQYQTLTVSASRSPGVDSTTNVYNIDMKYYSDGDGRSVWWQVVDARLGNVLQSGVEHVEVGGRTAVGVKDELVADLARQFATTRGVINNFELHETSQTLLGNVCVLRAEYLLDIGGAGDMAQMDGCLEKTLEVKPQDADSMATLSRVLLAPASGDVDAQTKERAVLLANRAVSIAPMSDRAQLALMTAQFSSGRTEAAISAGNRALALNPNNPDVNAKLSLVLFSAGFWDAGRALAEDARKGTDAMPRDALVVLALDAYRRSDWSQASLLSEQINWGDVLVRAIRTASLGQLGSDQAEGRLAEFRAAIPDFEKDMGIRLAARGIAPAITNVLEEGLVKAGASFSESKVAAAN